MSTDRVLDGPHGALRVRVYESNAPGPGLVWVHGGGFGGGSIEMPEADWLAQRFADAGIAVVSVDYTLAPLAPRGVQPEMEDATRSFYPVASEEIQQAFLWASASGLADGPWSIGGASAGGNLAAGVALRISHNPGPQPALVVLAYPTLHAVQPPPDTTLRARLDAEPDADHFGPGPVRRMYEKYIGAAVETGDIYAIPGTASVEALRGFAPTIMINGSLDELRVSGEAFAASLKSAGVEVDVSTEPHTRHGHLNHPELVAAHRSADRFARRILATRAHRNSPHLDDVVLDDVSPVTGHAAAFSTPTGRSVS